MPTYPQRSNKTLRSFHYSQRSNKTQSKTTLSKVTQQLARWQSMKSKETEVEQSEERSGQLLTSSKADNAFFRISGRLPWASRYGHCNTHRCTSNWRCLHASLIITFHKASDTYCRCQHPVPSHSNNRAVNHIYPSVHEHCTWPLNRRGKIGQFSWISSFCFVFLGVIFFSFFKNKHTHTHTHFPQKRKEFLYCCDCKKKRKKNDLLY